MHILVSVIKDNTLHYAKIFDACEYGTELDAEDRFLDYCRVHISNFDDYDILSCLRSGYAEFKNGSVCLNWIK